MIMNSKNKQKKYQRIRYFVITSNFEVKLQASWRHIYLTNSKHCDNSYVTSNTSLRINFQKGENKIQSTNRQESYHV